MIPHRLAAALLVPGLLVLPAHPSYATGSPGPLPSEPAPGPPPAPLVAAARALGAGAASAALAALAALPAELPHWAGEADLLAGIAALRAGRAADAVAPLERAARRLPVLADLARVRRADALRQAGDPSAAAVAYETVLREHPNSPWAGEAAAALGGARAAEGDLERAIAADHAYLAAHPDSPLADGVRLRLGRTLERTGRAGEAAVVYRALLVERPLSAAADEAAEQLARLAGAQRGMPALSNDERLARGLVLFDAYRSAEALLELETVDLTKLPDGEAGPQAQEVRLKRGLALFRLRRYPDAARALARVASTRGAAGEEARFWRARALARQGRPKEAIAAFTALAASSPSSRFGDRAAYLAAVVLDDQGERDEALARFRTLADRAGRSPIAADALWQIAWNRYRAAELVAAEDAFGELMRRFAGTDVADRALYWRARAELRLGRTGAALARLADLVVRRPLSYYGWQAARQLGEQSSGAVEIARTSTAGETPYGREPTCCRLASIEDPVPAGLERAALLVDLGLLAEARVELAAILRAPGRAPLVDAARLLHAAGDYSRPLAIARGAARTPLERLAHDPELRLFPLAFPRGYRAAVEAAARAFRVPPHLAYAIIRAESVFDPLAISPVGARGLMQLMPATARGLAGSLGVEAFDVDLLFDPGANIRFGMALLGRLLARFQGRPHLAIAAYNAGAEAVSRWVAELGDLSDDELVESIPYVETRGYVKKVLAFWRTYDALY